jgi:hypothetical protein
MTTYAVERERFIQTMQVEGMAPEIARRILRHANTVQRLSVLACNGERRLYVPCPASYAGREELCLCDKPDGQHEKIPPVAIELARAKRLIREWCDRAASSCTCGRIKGDPPGHRPTCARRRFVPIFDGDPRGACTKIKVPSGRSEASWRVRERRYDNLGGEGICVPTRRY